MRSSKKRDKKEKRAWDREVGAFRGYWEGCQRTEGKLGEYRVLGAKRRAYFN